MNSVLKLNAVQSGAFSSSKNLLDFDLPAGSQYDMESSYVNLLCDVASVDADSATGVGVYNYEVVWSHGGTEHNLSLPNVALVKHARLTSEQVPVLEDIRRVDVLRTQQDSYAKNLDDVEGVGYRKLFQNVNQGNIKYGPGLELFKEGSTKSVQRQVEIQIPMKDIFELGKMKALPGDKLGQVRAHLEMNFGKVALVQLQGSGTRILDDGIQFGQSHYCNFEDSAVAGGDLGKADEPLVTKQVFKDISESPYYNGMKLEMTGTKRTGGVATGAVTQIAIIENIEHLKTGANAGKLAITFSERLTNNGAGEDVIGISIDGVDAQSLTLTFLEAEMVLEKRMQNEPMDKLVYSTYTVEEDNGNALTDFARQYSVEREAFNVNICLPANGTDITCENSGQTQYESYRLMNDQVFLTDRNVDYKKPLYYDRTSMWFLNQGLPLRNLTDRNERTDVAFQDRLRTNPRDIIFIGSPLPISPQMKQLQVDIRGDSTKAGVNKILLYKSVVRSVNL